MITQQVPYNILIYKPLVFWMIKVVLDMQNPEFFQIMLGIVSD